MIVDREVELTICQHT